MNFILKATNVALTPSIEQYIEEKLYKTAERLAGKANAPSAKMILEVGKPSRHHKKGLVWSADATLYFGRNSLRAEAAGETLQVAIDLLEDELAREVTAFKGKADAKSKRSAREFKKELKLSPSAKSKRTGRVREEGI